MPRLAELLPSRQPDGQTDIQAAAAGRAPAECVAGTSEQLEIWEGHAANCGHSSTELKMIIWQQAAPQRDRRKFFVLTIRKEGQCVGQLKYLFPGKSPLSPQQVLPSILSFLKLQEKSLQLGLRNVLISQSGLSKSREGKTSDFQSS